MKTAIIAQILTLFTMAFQFSCKLYATTTKTSISGQPFVADLYSSTTHTNRTAILYLGGSEGGLPQPHLPEFFARNGYPVIAVAYFKKDELPETLQMVPLEYFDKPLDWLQQKHQATRIVAVGVSKGAELALLLASRKPEIKGVIAMSPSSVVWDGLPNSFWPPDPRSSWSAAGKPIPFVPYDYSKGFATGSPDAVLKFYQQALTQAEAVKKAAIPVEKINGPLLLLSGRDDQLWPAAQMGEAICARLKEKQFGHPYEHVTYKDAGHTLNEFFMIGGTVEGNRKARIDLSERILRFLGRHK